MPARMLEALERRVFRRSKAYGSWSDPDVRVKSTGSRFAKRGSSARSDEMSALAAQSRAHGLSPFTEVGSGKALTTGAARSTIGVPLRPFSAAKGDLVLPSAPDIPLRHHGNETIDTGRFADVLKKCRSKCRSPIFADSSETPGLRQKQ